MRRPWNHRVIGPTFTLLLAAGLIAFATSPPRAQTLEEERDLEERGFYQSYVFGQPDEPSRDWILAYGGRLYDQWWAVLLQEPPEGRHPSYPAEGRGRDEDSWRCVECHGRDYRGRARAFARGEHFTGIAGPRGAGKTILLRQYALEHGDAFYLGSDIAFSFVILHIIA